MVLFLVLVKPYNYTMDREGRLYQYRVGIESRYQQTITFDSGVKLFQDTWIEHQEKATLAGTITFVPQNDDLGAQVGDTMFFRYDVVAEGDAIDGQRKHFNEIMLPGGKTEWFVAGYQVVALDKGGSLLVPKGLLIAKRTEVETFKSSILVVPEQFATQKSNTILEILHVSPQSEYKPGDKILVIPELVQHYNLKSHYGDDICLVKEKYIIGKL
jgi:hypothetical protein